jgi:hypothetical protein
MTNAVTPHTVGANTIHTHMHTHIYDDGEASPIKLVDRVHARHVLGV